jgi:hypothetical protein
VEALAAVTASAAGNTGLKIETSTDTIPAFISTPMIGGVTAELNALTMGSATGTDKTASVTFKTTTPFTASASTNKITLSFPAGLVTAQAINLCGITSPASVVSTSAYATNVITLTVTSALANNNNSVVNHFFSNKLKKSAAHKKRWYVRALHRIAHPVLFFSGLADRHRSLSQARPF